MLALHMLLFTKSGRAGEHGDFGGSGSLVQLQTKRGSGAAGRFAVPMLLPAPLRTFPAVNSQSALRSSSERASQGCHLSVWFWHWKDLTKADFTRIWQILPSCTPGLIITSTSEMSTDRKLGECRPLVWVAHIWSLTKPRSVPCKGKIKGCMATWAACQGVRGMGSGCASTRRCCRTAVPFLVLCFAPVLLRHLSQHHVQTEA